MKKQILLLAAGLMMGAAVADAATVYFENTGNWATVNVWSWGGPDATNGGSWPGKTSLSETVTENGKTYFKYETQCTDIVFVNSTGSPQTPNLSVVDNMIYNASGATGNLFGGGSVEFTTEVYFVGKMTDWHKESAYKFSTTNNEDYTLNLASVKDEFKIVVVSSGDSWLNASTSGTLKLGETYTLVDNNGPDMTVGTVEDVTISFNITTNQMVIVGKADPENPPVVDPTEDYTKWYLNVVGDFNEWKDNGVAFNEEGVASIKDLAIGTSGFKVKVWNGEDVWYSTGAPVAVGTEVKIAGNADANMTVEGATAESVYTVTFNCVTGEILIEAQNEPVNPPVVDPTEDYTKWYLNVVGDFNEWKDNGVAFNEEGVATIKGLELGAGVFKLKVWNGDKDLWYSTGGAVALSEPIKITDNIDPGMTVLDPVDGTLYNVTFNCVTNEMTVVADGTVGVSEVEAEEEALYFNLQGVQVANPADGIYVKVVNGKATKVYVK